MFLGHFGLAMAAKRVAPRPALGTTIAAAQFADVIWPVFVLLGIDQVQIAPGITAATPLDFVWIGAWTCSRDCCARQGRTLGVACAGARAVRAVHGMGSRSAAAVSRRARLNRLRRMTAGPWGYWIERHRTTRETTHG